MLLEKTIGEASLMLLEKTIEEASERRPLNSQQDERAGSNAKSPAVTAPRWSFVNRRRDNSRRGEFFEPSSSYWRFDSF